MKWPTFTIIALLMLIMQLSTSSFIALGPQGIVPDFLLLTGILIAFRASSDEDALLQCWILGMLHDLTSVTPFGIYSTTLALAGLLIIVMRKWLYVQNIFMIVLWTFLFTALIEHIAILTVILRGQIPAENFGRISQLIWFAAAYTAAISPYLQLFIKQQKWTLNN